MKVCVMGKPFVPCRIGQVLGIFPVTAFCFCFGFVKNGSQFIGKAVFSFVSFYAAAPLLSWKTAPSVKKK